MSTRIKTGGLTVKVDLKRATGGDLMRALLAQPGNADIIQQAVQKKVNAMLTKKVNWHYQHAVKVILEELLDPRIGVRAGSTIEAGYAAASGRPRIAVTTANGKQVRIDLPWAPLTYNYAARNPESTRFWHKTGKLRRALQAQAREARQVQAGKGRVLKNKLVWQFQIKLGSLPAPLDQWITQRFISGDDLVLSSSALTSGVLEGLSSIKTGPLKGLNSEARRPFIRLLAARMGREMLRDLRGS